MLIDNKKGDGFFESDSQHIFDYASEKNIVDACYLNFVGKYCGGFVADNTIIINDEEYTIQCFLGTSENTAYDIVKCNKIRDVHETPLCAIALLYGDDLICINANDGHVYFWNDEDLIKVADNFEDFINKINLI